MPAYTFSTSQPFDPKTRGTVDRLNRGWKNSMALKQGDQALDRLRGLEVASVLTGTQNNYDPDGAIVRWNGAANVTFNGVVPKGGGDIRVFENVTGGFVMGFAHEAAASTAANRFALSTGGGLYVGGIGAIGFVYDSTTSRWRLLFVDPGLSIAVPHAAGNFAGDASTWGVDAADQVTFAYRQSGPVVDVWFEVENTDVGAGNAYLKVTLPNSWTVRGSRRATGAADVRDNGTYSTGVWVAVPGDAFVRFYRSDRANWINTGGDNTNVAATMRFEVA